MANLTGAGKSGCLSKLSVSKTNLQADSTPGALALGSIFICFNLDRKIVTRIIIIK